MTKRKPLKPSQTAAKPGSERRGPVWPYPEIRVKMREALRGVRSEGPIPHFSMVPGLKLSSRVDHGGVHARIQDEVSAKT